MEAADLAQYTPHMLQPHNSVKVATLCDISFTGRSMMHQQEIEIALFRISVNTFCTCRGRPEYQLPSTQAAQANFAIFQLTATLPFSVEVAFLGGQSDMQKTIRGPVKMCAACESEQTAKSESHEERIAALSGEIWGGMLW